MATKTYKYNQNSNAWKNETGTPVNPSSTLGLQLRLRKLQNKSEVEFTNEEVQQFEQNNKGAETAVETAAAVAPPMEEKKPIIANKKELLAQSSYLTRLNDVGCRQGKSAFIVSVTFNSDSFPKIKKDGVFKIVPNSEYNKLINVLAENVLTPIERIDNVFRIFDAKTHELICVAYALYQNELGQNALEAKPKMLEINMKKIGTSDLDIDTMIQHFLHDWAASFDIDTLQIREDGKSVFKASIPKDETQLYAAQKRCGTNSGAMPWSVSRQGAITTAEKLQKQYSYQGSSLPNLSNMVFPAYIGPQIFGEETLKQFDIIGKSFRSSPFENSKLFKIYYSPNLVADDFATLFLNDVEQSLMGEARGIGSALRMEREGAKYRSKLEKQGRVRMEEKPIVTETPVFMQSKLGGGGPGMPQQDPDAIAGLDAMKTNLINGNFGQIEEIADVLAKNGYERFTIKRIGNDDAGTLANAFLNNPQNKNYVKEFADLVKQCRFKLDCESKDKLEYLYTTINTLFDEFVNDNILTGYENKQIVIVDNYPSLKQKYIDFFIKLQQRIRRSRKGRGKLTGAEKAQIESGYMPEGEGGQEEEGLGLNVENVNENAEPIGTEKVQAVKKTTQISNFFMGLWSGLVGKLFRKKSQEGEGEGREEGGLNIEDINVEGATPLPGSKEAEPPVAFVDAYAPLENEFNQLQTRVITFLDNPKAEEKDNLVKTFVKFYNQVNDDMNVLGNTDERYEKLKEKVIGYLNVVYRTIFEKVASLTPRQNITNFEFGIQLFSELTNSNSNNTILADRSSKVTNLMNRLKQIEDEAGILPEEAGEYGVSPTGTPSEEEEPLLGPGPFPFAPDVESGNDEFSESEGEEEEEGRPPNAINYQSTEKIAKSNYPSQAAAIAREKLGFIPGAVTGEESAPAAESGYVPLAPAKSEYTNIGEPNLPPGWIQATDPTSGQPYYYTMNKSKTSWEKPTEEYVTPQQISGPTTYKTSGVPSPVYKPSGGPQQIASESLYNRPRPTGMPGQGMPAQFPKVSRSRPLFRGKQGNATAEALQAMAEARALGSDPTSALQGVVPASMFEGYGKEAQEREKEAEKRARETFGKSFTGFGGSYKTKKNTKKNTKRKTKKIKVMKERKVKKERKSKKGKGQKGMKGKQGKTKRIAKKTGRRYYLKTLKNKK